MWCGMEWSRVEWNNGTRCHRLTPNTTTREGGRASSVAGAPAPAPRSARPSLHIWHFHDMTVYTHLRCDPHGHHLYIYGINLQDTGDPRAASSLPYMALRGMAFCTTLNTGHLRRAFWAASSLHCTILHDRITVALHSAPATCTVSFAAAAWPSADARAALYLSIAWQAST